ncbi:SUKH-3 domain-containing protein [Streptomyces venezuelae]|uniref:SUKH-3 domain-containing protein n=1 Tax=Streptomyces venezuelae TaxID=54571 RepID=UPI001CC26FA7|nr:SUKH-3 domain-containing protein [Streptomyces venezuelae]
MDGDRAADGGRDNARASAVTRDEAVSARLAEAGWFPGRDIGARLPGLLAFVIDRFAEEGHPVEPFPAARDFVRAFGGLRLVIPGSPPAAVGFTPHWIYEESGEDVAELARNLGRRLFPVGYETFDGAMVLVDETGRFFLLHHTGPYFLGATAHEAVGCLLYGPQREAREFFV